LGIDKNGELVMLCLHCNVSFFEEWTKERALVWDEDSKMGQSIAYVACPNCSKLMVKIIEGAVDEEVDDFCQDDNEKYLITNEFYVYPHKNESEYSEDVPAQYQEDLREAEAVLLLSPKASAALTRRLLQKILNEELKIHHSNLSKQIDVFLEDEKIPAHISKSVDAIRNIGNFSAHPLKETNSGAIVDVEPGEAEWSIEVIKSLFDYLFIQPKRIERKRNELNAKLKSLGKPEMK
jgi:hypothetical protein